MHNAALSVSQDTRRARADRSQGEGLAVASPDDDDDDDNADDSDGQADGWSEARVPQTRRHAQTHLVLVFSPHLTES